MENENSPRREAKNHKEASEQGVKQTLEKYSVFPASYYAWKRKWKQWAGFSHGMTPDQLKRIRELEKKISC
jgi:putative transposase